jgi:hypothetical protein
MNRTSTTTAAGKRNSPSRAVSIRVLGHLAAIDSPPSILQEMLEYTFLRFQYLDGNGKWTVRTHQMYEYRDGALYVVAGSVPRLTEAL